jgi:hypothetical protein
MIEESPPGRDAGRALARMINGYWVTQMISTAARLDVAGALAEGPKTAGALAERCGAHPRSLYRLLRALASLGIFAETEDGRFTLTPLAELLRGDVPGSLRGLALYSGDPRQHRYGSWGDLYETVRTGEPAFPRLTGMRPFAYLAANTDLAETFHAAMVSYTTESVGAVLEHYDFSPYPQIVDVGGGHGRLLAEILKTHARACGAVFDLPQVLDGARKLFEQEGLAGRASCVAGDFFEQVPPGANLYMLKSVLHDWDDEKAVAILKSCRRAMTGEARLLLVESVIPSGNAPGLGKLMDINMMVIHGGLERTHAEWAKLLEVSRFALEAVTMTDAAVDLVQARPV